MKAACNLLLAGAALALALGSPATAAAQDKVLTLDAALATALEENPSLAASRETVAAADARVDQAWSGFLPQVLVNLGYRRTTLNSAAPPYYNTNFQVPTGLSPAALEALNALSGVFSSLPISHATSDSYNSWSASLTVSETLWDFGKTLASWRAQKELREGNSADLATTLALGSPSCVPYERLARLNNFGHRFAAAARFYARARDCGYTIETKNLRYFEEHAREVPPAWSVFDIPDSPDPEQMRAWRAAH